MFDVVARGPRGRARLQRGAYSDPLAMGLEARIPLAFPTANARPGPCWLLGLFVVTGCSWCRYVATGSPRVDGNYPPTLEGSLLLVAVAAGWGLMILAWRSFLARPPDQPQRLAFAGLLTAHLMLPMLSNDVFSVFAYASLAARGRDVYTDAAGLTGPDGYKCDPAWLGLPRAAWWTSFGSCFGWSSASCAGGPRSLRRTRCSVNSSLRRSERSGVGSGGRRGSASPLVLPHASHPRGVRRCYSFRRRRSFAGIKQDFACCGDDVLSLDRPPTVLAALIREIATSNSRWGAERIRGELLKLGIRVSKRTVQRYMRRSTAAGARSHRGRSRSRRTAP